MTKVTAGASELGLIPSPSGAPANTTGMGKRPRLDIIIVINHRDWQAAELCLCARQALCQALEADYLVFHQLPGS